MQKGRAAIATTTKVLEKIEDTIIQATTAAAAVFFLYFFCRSFFGRSSRIFTPTYSRHHENIMTSVQNLSDKGIILLLK
jgi:hypothetical protein